MNTLLLTAGPQGHLNRQPPALDETLKPNPLRSLQDHKDVADLLLRYGGWWESDPQWTTRMVGVITTPLRRETEGFGPLGGSAGPQGCGGLAAAVRRARRRYRGRRMVPTPSTIIKGFWTKLFQHSGVAPGTLNHQPSTLNPQPSTLNPQPSTLNPQPSTLNPTSYTPHPTPYTLHPQP